AVVQDALGLPGGQLPELLGERARITGQLEGLHREEGRGGVMAMGVGGSRRKARQNHVRPEDPDDPHAVREDGVLAPDPERLAIVLGVSEVTRAREELLASVEATCGEQLLGARYPERLAELRAEEVLAAIATREGQIGGSIATAPRQVRDDMRVLVVGMRRDIEHAAERAEALQLVENDEPLRRLAGGTVRGPAHQQAYGESDQPEDRAQPRGGLSRGPGG